jgi:hypothetical protein
MLLVDFRVLRWWTCAAFALSIYANDAAAQESEHRWSIDVYGLSYHWNRELAHRNNTDNERNLGIGLNYEFERTPTSRTFADAGMYLDSGRNIARYGGVGWQGRLGQSRFMGGGAIVLFHSETYNDNHPFVAPVPLLTYEFTKFSMTLFHFIKYEHLNHVAVSGLFVTIPIGK